METDSRPGAAAPWWRPRWWELWPEASVAVGMTVFLVQQTDAALSSFKSPQAIVLMTIVAVIWVGGRIMMARFVPWVVPRMATFAIAGAAVLAVAVLPAYDNKTVVETLSDAPPAASTTKPDMAAAAASTTAPTTAAPTRVRLREGALRGVDHRASGTVVIIREPDGRFIVGLEDIDIQPGPDYDVYLVPGAGKEDRDGGQRIDDLRGNKGTQYYDVPEELDLADGEWSVLVWCHTFAVPIATATPTPA